MWFSRRDPRVRDEIRFHRDRLIDDYMAAGMDRAEAERRAFLEFGNPAQIEESVRDERGRWLEDLGRDLRYALRTLGRNRGFAAVAVSAEGQYQQPNKFIEPAMFGGNEIASPVSILHIF